MTENEDPDPPRESFAAAVARTAVAPDRENRSRDLGRPVPVLPPATVVHIVLGGLGAAAFLMGFILAVGGSTSIKQIEGLVSLVIGSVLIVGGLIVDAITRLRLDLWQARQAAALPPSPTRPGPDRAVSPGR
jgi:hypothetical protein